MIHGRLLIALSGVLITSALGCLGPRLVYAGARLNSVLPATAPTSTVGTIRRIRVDSADGRMYVLGNSTTAFGEISFDGTTFSALSYNVALPTTSASDITISNGRAFIVATGATNAVYRYDIDGSMANLVASHSLSSGTGSIALDGNGSVYVSKTTALYLFDEALSLIGSTSTFSSSVFRMDHDGNYLYYLSSGGRFGKMVPGVSDTVISTSGPVGGALRGFAVSHDGDALYYGTASAFYKLSGTSGAVLWSVNVSNLVDLDVSTSTGRITTVNTGGSVSLYDPINAVSSFSASASGTSAILEWDAGISDTDYVGTVIRRSTTGYPASITDGTAVTSSSMSSTFTDTGLSNGTYYYSVFNETMDGYASAPATSTVTIHLPPDAPELVTTTDGSSIRLDWSVPVGATSFVLRRSTYAFPSDHTDGTAVTTTGSGVTSLTETGMTDGTYYYSLFAGDDEGAYSQASTASAMIDTTGPTAPSDFFASVTGDVITLTWSNPPDADFAQSVLRRSTLGYPASITDGTVVTSTTETRYIESSLEQGVYYYSIFAQDALGNVSLKATVSATVATRVSSGGGGGSGGGSGSIVLPSAMQSAPLSFFILNSDQGSVSSSTVRLQLNANPSTVRGYAVSLDPSFAGTSLLTLNGGEASVTLPDVEGVYTVYLYYYSVTGQRSERLSRTITYAPARKEIARSIVAHRMTTKSSAYSEAHITTR